MFLIRLLINAIYNKCYERESVDKIVREIFVKREIDNKKKLDNKLRATSIVTPVDIQLSMSSMYLTSFQYIEL